MRVLIAGGGIAGPVLGVALRRVGLDATVYEAAAHDQVGAGAFLQLAPNGMNALAAAGLGHAADAAGGFPTTGIRFENHRGRIVGELKSGDEQQRFGTSNRLVKRGPLHAALRAAADEHDVAMHHGKRLVSYTCTAAGVEVRFADGTSARGDVLIGCDGIWSRTRRQLLDRGPTPEYTGLVNFGGFASLAIDEVASNRMVFGRRAFFGYTAAPDGQVYWFSNVPESSEVAARQAGADLSIWWERLLSVHAEDPDPVPQILAASAPPVGAWPIYDLPTLPRWHGDRVCLVGDAAHAMSPSAGQGASIAIEDAVVLAGCLRNAPTPGEAFARYEQRRKDRAEAVVEQARRNSSNKIPGPLGGAVRDLLLPLFLRIGLKQAAATYSHTVSLDLEAADAVP